MMSKINVNCSVSDQVYHYKMPKLLAKVEGKGNVIKTVVVNMVEVAKVLNRPPTYPTKYLGCELGVQTQFDIKNERYIVNGSHEAAKLQDLLDGFIKKFVLCPACDNPETVLNSFPKKGVINTKCIACGYKGQLDSTHKLTSFILKNPPGQDPTKKGKRKSKDEKTPKKQQNGDDNYSHSPQHDSDLENGSPEKLDISLVNQEKLAEFEKTLSEEKKKQLQERKQKKKEERRLQRIKQQEEKKQQLIAEAIKREREEALANLEEMEAKNQAKEIEDRSRREKMELKEKQVEERLSNLRTDEKPAERPATNWQECEQMKKESWGPLEDRVSRDRPSVGNESRDWRTKVELPPREDVRNKSDWKKPREESGGSWRKDNKPAPLFQRSSYRDEPRRDGSRERRDREPELSNWRSGGGAGDKYPPRREPERDTKRYSDNFRDKDRPDDRDRGMGCSNYSRDRDSFRRNDPLDRRGKDCGGFSSRGEGGGGFGSRNEGAGGPRRTDDKAPKSSWRSGSAAPVGSWRDGGRRDVEGGPERRDGLKSDSYRRDRPRDPDNDGFLQVRR